MQGTAWNHNLHEKEQTFWGFIASTVYFSQMSLKWAWVRELMSQMHSLLNVMQKKKVYSKKKCYIKLSLQAAWKNNLQCDQCSLIHEQTLDSCSESVWQILPWTESICNAFSFFLFFLSRECFKRVSTCVHTLVPREEPANASVNALQGIIFLNDSWI